MSCVLPTEIACDESGSDGENLIAGGTRVFAHGSTNLSLEEADALIEGLQLKTNFGGAELKSTRVLKGKHLRTTLGLFEPGGPLDGRVRVSITDKAYMAVCKIVDLVIEEDAYSRGEQLHQHGVARQMARDLFAEGPRAYGADVWQALLGQFVSFVRSTQRRGAKTSLDQLLRTVDDLRLKSRRRRVEEAMQLLWRGRSELARYAEVGGMSQEVLRTLDPVVPAVMQTAGVWHEALASPIRLVHDRNSALTTEACAEIMRAGAHPHPDFPIKVPIESIRLVDSREDARVQIADIVAGLGAIAGRSSLEGRLDPDIRKAVEPSLISSSLWADAESWRLLNS